jgi:hypothetical protein
LLGTEKVGFRGFHQIFRKGILVGSDKAGDVLRVVGCSEWSATVMCADNTVVIPMRACDRGKSEARGARSAEGAPCEGCFVVRARSNALTW